MATVMLDPVPAAAYDCSHLYQYIVVKLCKYKRNIVSFCGYRPVYISAEIATKKSLSSEECQRRMTKCFKSMTEVFLTSKDDPRYFIFRFVASCDKGIVDKLGFFLWCPDGASEELLSVYKAKRNVVCSCFPGVEYLGDYTTADSQDCATFIESLPL